MYQKGIITEFLAERAAETGHRGCAALTELETFSPAFESVFRSLKDTYTLPQEYFGKLLQLTGLSIEREKEVRVEKSRSLWNPIINLGDEL